MFVIDSVLNCDTPTPSLSTTSVLREINNTSCHAASLNGPCCSTSNPASKMELIETQRNSNTSPDVSSCSTFTESIPDNILLPQSKNKSVNINEITCNNYSHTTDASQEIIKEGSHGNFYIQLFNYLWLILKIYFILVDIQSVNQGPLVKKENSTFKKRRQVKRISGKSNPVAMRTGELTLKIFSDKSVCQRELSRPNLNKRKSSLSPSSNSSVSPGHEITSSFDRPQIEVDEPVDCCPSCGSVFVSIAISGSVFCLKTGNVLVTCSHCSALIVMRNSFNRIPPV